MIRWLSTILIAIKLGIHERKHSLDVLTETNSASISTWMIMAS